MRMKIEELKRASEGDILELEGIVHIAKDPNSKDFDGEIVWGQFVVLKDGTGDQGCWLNLDSEKDKVSKGTKISIKGKLGKEYKTRKGTMARSINGCHFEVLEAAQAPAQSTESKPKSSYEQKDDYWTKKFKYEVQRDPKVQLAIVRQTAIKAMVDLMSSKVFIIKTKKDFYNSADEIVEYILKGLDIMENAIFGVETKEEPKNEPPEVETGTKEERTKKAEEIVGGTQFKPASTKQKNFIYGHKGDDGVWKKGMIESRYIEDHEIEEIGDPKKLSIEKASEWIDFWLGESGNTEDIGERQKREFDNPRDSKGVPLNKLVKGDKTSLQKDILVDEVNALRRKCRLNDDEKFKKEIGYSPKIESLTEKDLTKVKEILKGYAPF